jgi:hypothetical protein
MLVVMTFNMGLFLAAVGGLTLGYMVFGYIRKTEEKLIEGERIYSPDGDKCCADVEFD